MDEILLVANSKEEREKIIEFAKSNEIQYNVEHFPENDYEEELKKVFKGMKSKSYDKQHYKWLDYLQENLVFPFKAFLKDDSLDIEDIEKIIDNYIRSGGNNVVDNSIKDVNVKAISTLDDLRGTIVEIRKGRKKYHVPLCEIEPTDYESKNWELVNTYTS